MPKPKPAKYASMLLRLWHAIIAGGFLVAYVTADEDTYALHLFAGYVVLAAVVARVAVGLIAPHGSLWRLPRPSIAGTRAWLRTRRGRNPLFGWIAAALLIAIGIAAGSGAIADVVTWIEDFHEGAGETALWVVLAHIGMVIVLYNGRRIAAWIKLHLAGKETVQ